MMLPTPMTTARMMMQPQLLLLSLMAVRVRVLLPPVKGLIYFYSKITSIYHSAFPGEYGKAVG